MGQILQIVVAVLGAYVLYRIGFAMIASFSRSTPEPPPPGELRQVKLTYRCSLCGTEMRMTRAPQEHPEPPRCCMEPMDLTKSPDL